MYSFPFIPVLPHHSPIISGLLLIPRHLLSKLLIVTLNSIDSVIRKVLNADRDLSGDKDDSGYVDFPKYSQLTLELQ